MSFWIKIDGEAIDLPEKQGITLERYNPMFDFETVRGSRVLDFGAMISPKNDLVFWHYRHHQTAYPDKEWYCEKYADGMLIEKGFLELVGVTDSYMLRYSQNLGEVFGAFQTMRLNKLPLGGVLVGSTSTSVCLFPKIKNTLFYGTNVRAGFGAWVNDMGNANSPKVPMLRLKWVFEQLGRLCDFRFVGDFVESRVFEKLLLYNTYSLDEATDILWANHLPELTIPEFLKELCKLLNVAMFFDVQERVLCLRWRKGLMKQATRLNWTEKVLPSVNRIPERAKYVELDWELDGGDGLMKALPKEMERWSNGLDVQQEGDVQRLFYNGHEVFEGERGGLYYLSNDGNRVYVPVKKVQQEPFFGIKSKFSTLLTDTGSGYAMAEQVGISPLFGQMNNRFGARLLLENGVDKATSKIEGFSLSFHGVANLVETCWQEFVDWRMNTFSRKAQVLLTAKDVAEVDFHVRQGEDVAVHIDGVDYYIEQLRINLPLGGYSELGLWRV